MKYSLYLIILVSLAGASAASAADGPPSGGGGFSQPQEVRRLTPEEKALASYRRGLKHRDKAAKLELKAADETNERKLGKLQKKITREYEKAIDDYEKAVGHYPMLYQAHSSLGYALRKIDRFDESLAAYNRSLDINAYYHEAIEYRAEAYLGLNRLDDAKEAYMQLFQENRALADELMAAMIAWVAERRVDPGNLDATVVEEFANWVEQRNTLASYIQPADGTLPGRWSASN